MRGVYVQCANVIYMCVCSCCMYVGIYFEVPNNSVCYAIIYMFYTSLALLLLSLVVRVFLELCICMCVSVNEHNVSSR